MNDAKPPPDIEASSELPEIPVEVDASAPAAELPSGAPDDAEGAIGAPGAPVTLDPGLAQPAGDERVEKLEKEKQELHERLLRTAADFDNFRKRSRREADEARVRAREEVLRGLLPVADNLERALGSAAASADGLLEGVRLVLRQTMTALERFEVKPFESRGQAFDPARHEALSQVETAEVPPGAVAIEMQRGYTIGDRLLRPALVAVARAPVAPAPDPAGSGATTPDAGAPETAPTSGGCASEE